MRRVFGQLGLADGLVTRRSGSLEQIAGVLDWGSLAALMCAVQAAPIGRPGYGPLVLLRCVLLQQWYGLSDPALEEALNDRLSFGILSVCRCRTRCRITRRCRAFAKCWWSSNWASGFWPRSTGSWKRRG